jgi:hypothetical protein
MKEKTKRRDKGEELRSAIKELRSRAALSLDQELRAAIKELRSRADP